MFVDSLAQAYHWSFEDMKSLTLPQLLLMNHAAEVNRKRADETHERKKKREELRKQQKEKEELKNPWIEEFGKRFDEMDSDEQLEYFRMKTRGMNSVRT